MYNYAETRILVRSKSKDEFKPVKIYRDSEGRKWIEAHNGSEFQIEISPQTYSTHLAVVSVDGLNVITGQEAKKEPKDGYILSSYQKLKISGWRTSLNEVRKFVFTNNRKETYANKLNNDTTNNGVIGICLFAEKITYGNWYSTSGYSLDIFPKSYTTGVDLTRSIQPTATCSCVNDSMSMGTKQGQASYDSVIEVNKEFLDECCFMDAIYNKLARKMPLL